jgi:arabinofuranosyltransferase
LVRSRQTNFIPTLKAAVIGFSPLLAWEVFSLLYYGFLVPNTAYAKLNTGVPQTMLLAQGWLYFMDGLRWDPLTIIATVFGLGIAFWSGRERERALGLGVLLYLGFIIWVGGDFMRGRFFAVPFLVSSVLLVRWWAHFPVQTRRILLGAISVFGVASAIIRPLMMENESLIAESGIADERGFYFWATGLINNDLRGVVPVYPWVFEGIELRESGVKVSVQETIGFRGYFAGPGVHIVDRLALSDPLLARLPIPDPTDWRIGHFRREIPVGYVPSLPDEEIHLLDAGLKAYYGHLRLITRGRLFDPARLKTIIWMNLGKYEMLTDRYTGH